jgi:hypothetical protein
MKGAADVAEALSMGTEIAPPGAGTRSRIQFDLLGAWWHARKLAASSRKALFERLNDRLRDG